MHKDYLHFSSADFIADEYFQGWVNNPDGESSIFWEQWVADHPAKRQDIEEARAFIINIHFNTDLPVDKQVELAFKKNLQRIDSFEESHSKKHKKLAVRNLYIYWLAAAVIASAVLISGWKYWMPNAVTIEQITGNGEVKSIVLPDSSVVTLNENSSIRYASDLNSVDSREVWLEGEVFFDVRHIEKNRSPKRFIVHSGNLNVEVLGTTFNVKKRATITNVTLNTGQIKIDLKDDPGSVIYLQPGDFVQYSIMDKHLLKKQVKPELYSVWKDEKIDMDNIPLSEVAQFIRDTYGYQIEVEKGLENDRISGKLLLKNESAIIETLSFVLNINIIKKDSVLLFQSKQKN